MRAALWLSLMLVACGGIAVVDGDNGTTTTSSSTTSTTSTSTTTSSSTTTSTNTLPVQCVGTTECCGWICDYVELLPCWDPGDPCECGDAPLDTPECAAAWNGLVECVAYTLPGSVQCVGGMPGLNCNVCDDVRAEAEIQCGEAVPCNGG